MLHSAHTNRCGSNCAHRRRYRAITLLKSGWGSLEISTAIRQQSSLPCGISTKHKFFLKNRRFICACSLGKKKNSFICSAQKKESTLSLDRAPKRSARLSFPLNCSPLLELSGLKRHRLSTPPSCSAPDTYTHQEPF